MFVKVECPEEALCHVHCLFDRLQKINKFKFMKDFQIKVDYLEQENLGVCYNNENAVHVYPKNCQCYTGKSIGYTEDYTLFSVAIHEFAHYLDMKLEILK